MSWLSVILTLTLTITCYYIITIFYLEVLKKKGKSFWKKLKLNKNHPRLNTVLGLSLLILLGGSIGLFCFNISNRIAYFKFGISGSSEWVYSNGQKYLHINADNNYDLGYHTGYQLSSEVFKMKFLLSVSEASFGVSYAQFLDLSEKYLPFIPQKYIEEMQGLSEGASAGSGFPISFSDILIQNVIFEILYGLINPLDLSVENTLGCTTFGSKNHDGTIIIGQNMDLVKPFSWVQSFVLHKVNDDPYVFSYRLGGCLAMPMGKNEYGLTLITNLVQTKIVAPIMTPTFVLIREGLEKEKSVDDLYDSLFPSNKSSYSRNFIIANQTTLLSVQSLPDNQTICHPETIVVQSNTFNNLYWQKYLVDDQYSKERQIYAESLIIDAFNDNELTNQELLLILKDTPIICRDEEGLIGMSTLAFMTSKSFGLGNPNGKIGILPF